MKRILLTSTALVAFAGAAAADSHTNIDWALGATLGYNDTDSSMNEDGTVRASSDENEEGFYWEGNLKLTATAALDNGLTAGAYFEIEVADNDGNKNNDGGETLVSSDFVVSLTSDMASLYFGDTSTAAAKHWVSAGDMESDGFTTDNDSAVLRGDVSFAGFETSLSYVVDDVNNEAEQLSIGASGAFGAFTVAAAYQEETTFVDSADDFNSSEIYGVSVGGTFAGATVTAAYAVDSNNGVGQSGVEQTSAGIKVAYPFGPVTATAYYVMEERDGIDDTDDNYGVKVAYVDNGIAVTADFQQDQAVSKWAVDGSYDLGNGLSAIAGVENQNEGTDFDYYVGATYDLGGGASVLMTYAEDADGDQEDEIGAGDYQEGITVEVSFAF